MTSTPDAVPDPTDTPAPTQIEDTSVIQDPTEDPAQKEWDRTQAPDENSSSSDAKSNDTDASATELSPDEVEVDDTQIPLEDLPTSRVQPETQGEDPVIAELGEEGEGDLGPGDA